MLLILPPFWCEIGLLTKGALVIGRFHVNEGIQIMHCIDENLYAYYNEEIAGWGVCICSRKP